MNNSNDSNDLISVICSAYNHECYIQETIRSIISQTYQNIELIIIDDGSKDTTFAKINELKGICEKRFVRVVFKTHENQRILTQNKLIDLAQGKYIFMTASDDFPKSHAIEKLHAFLSENQDYVLAVGDNEFVDADSKRIYWGKWKEVVPEASAIYKTFGEALSLFRKPECFGKYEELLKNNHIPNGYLIKREALIKVGKYNPSIFLEDWFISLQLAKIGKMKFIPEILFSYRWHRANTVSSEAFIKKSLLIEKQVYEHEKEYCFSHGYKKLWEKLWYKKFGFFAKVRNLYSEIKNIRKKIISVHWRKGDKYIIILGKRVY